MLPAYFTTFDVDNSDVIWIGTGIGLVRCDPEKGDWRIFTKEDGLAGYGVHSVHIARDGKIWFGNRGNGVTYYDPATQTWHTIPTSDNEFIIPKNIFEDNSGALWFFSSWRHGIHRWKPGGTQLVPQFKEGDRDREVRTAYQDRAGFIWIAYEYRDDEGIARYNPKTGQLQHFKEFDKKWINSIYEDSRGILWFGGYGVIASYDYQDKKIKFWDKNLNLKKKPYVNDIAEDWKGNIWLATGQGIFRSNGALNGWIKVVPKIITGKNETYSIKMGKNKDIWFRIEGWRYLCYKPGTNEWQSYKLKNGLPSCFPFSSFFKFNRQNWAISEQGLFLRENVKMDLWKPIDLDYLYYPRTIRSLFKTDFSGRFSIIQTHGGSGSRKSFSFHFGEISQYDIKKGYWYPYLVGSSNFSNNDIFFTKSGAVFLIDEGQIEGIQPSSKIWQPFKNKIKTLAVFEDAGGTVWISTEDGLYYGKWNTRNLNKTMIVDSGKLGSIRAIRENAGGSIWFGTYKAAVRYEPHSKRTEIVYLPESVKGPVNALYQDISGNLWIATSTGLLKYSNKDGKWKYEKFYKDINAVEEIREYNDGVLWALCGENTLYRYNPKIKNWKKIDLQTLGIKPNDRDWDRDNKINKLTLPDSNGKIWFQSDYRITSLGWNNDGVPGRKETLNAGWLEKWLGRISYHSNDKSFILWRTRLTGLLKSTATNATSFAADIGFPINVLEKAPDGGVWVGYTMGGLELRRENGKFTRFGTKDGLPNMTILDISQVPGNDAKPLAWIGTNDGAALVNKGRVIFTVKSNSDPGPVDVVLALPDGSAYFAFNPISPVLFLDPQDPLPRQDTYIKYVSTRGEIQETKIKVPRGQVLDMALDPDEKTVWVGTTAGLYRLKNKVIKQITSKGRLQPSSVRVVTVSPGGTVWMGIDGQDKIPASVVGFSPGRNDIKTLTIDDGLPEVSRIEMLDFAPDGRLAVLAGGRLVSGRVFVPLGALIYLVLALVIITAGLIFFVAWNMYQRKLKIASRYKPLLESAREFFETLGKPVEILNYRTLILSSDETKIYIRIALGDLLPVEEVLEAYKALKKSQATHSRESYLVFPNALDSAAARQLDVYRLRHNTVIVPIALPFIRTKIAAGPDAVREAQDGLLRRYLGQQDLFDMRNALDEARFFFGRKSLIDELFHALNRREHVALTGPRKAGKSSLLNVLCQRLNTYPTIMIDLQLYNRRDEQWPDQLLMEIISRYDRWGRARYGNKWNPPGLKADCRMSGPVFRDALETRRDIQKRLKNNQPLVIVMDEIERLFPNTGIQHDKVRQAERFILFTGILRALGQEGGDRLVSLIIADRQPLFNRVNSFKIPGVDTNPFYRFFQEFYLKPLDQNECTEMITEIGHAMGLEVEQSVLDSIYKDSGGYPALARQLASAASSKRKENIKIESRHYHEGLIWLHEERGDIDRFFKENFWDTMNSAERRILALAADEKGVPIETFKTIGSIPLLEGDAISVDETITDRARLLDTSRDMLATGILEKYKNSYRICGLLFRNWVRENTLWSE
ncbi:MAG: hypothetical protein JSV88_03855 [Candidatus Aminicenantes bacterium]|nr:MAG: hypothetical protein JSV88_03855 [Candidatus Aminicenantes bacterium]